MRRILEINGTEGFTALGEKVFLEEAESQPSGATLMGN
jgi:hypothetical protein